MEIYFNDISNQELGVSLYDLPIVSASNVEFEGHSVAGKRGTLISTNNAVSNITIDCVFSIVGDYVTKYRNIKRWLKGIGKLVLSESSETYYDVLSIERGDNERELSSFGTFEVTFNCFPYEFLKSGDDPIILTETILQNDYDDSMPIYYIEGEGVCELIVNGNKMRINIGQNVTIDTRRMIAYRTDGSLVNTTVTGNYDVMYLKNGDNSITISAGFSLTIYPKWGYES